MGKRKFLVYANEDGKTQAFFVPAGTEGLTVGEKDKLMGIRALPTHKLTLESFTRRLVSERSILLRNDAHKPYRLNDHSIGKFYSIHR